MRRAHSLTFSCRLSFVFSCVFSVFLFIPRRQLRLPFVTFVVRLDHGQQAAGDAFNGVIGNLHATVFLTGDVSAVTAAIDSVKGNPPCEIVASAVISNPSGETVRLAEEEAAKNHFI